MPVSTEQRSRVATLLDLIGGEISMAQLQQLALLECDFSWSGASRDELVDEISRGVTSLSAFTTRVADSCLLYFLVELGCERDIISLLDRATLHRYVSAWLETGALFGKHISCCVVLLAHTFLSGLDEPASTTQLHGDLRGWSA